MRLRKCICGGTPKHYPYDDSGVYPDEHSIIYCPECNLATLEYWGASRAMRSWNAIIRKKLKETK